MWNLYLYARSYIFQSCNFRSCIFSPAFSGPPFPPLHFWSSIFRSCIFHPAFLVMYFLSCIFRSRIFSPTFSRTAFIVPQTWHHWSRIFRSCIFRSRIFRAPQPRCTELRLKCYLHQHQPTILQIFSGDSGNSSESSYKEGPLRSFHTSPKLWSQTEAHLTI